MESVRVALVGCEAGDWVGLYIDGKLKYEGHDMGDNVWMNMIRNYKYFESIDDFTVTDEYMEAGLPESFDAMPIDEFIEEY